MREFPERRKTLNVFREAALTWGSYDDFPVAPAGIDRARTVMGVAPGDVVYVPARIPARIVPHGELLQVRLKGDPPFTEAAAWYCDTCDAFMHRVEFTSDVPQRQ